MQALIICGEESLAQSLAYSVGELGFRVECATEARVASFLIERQQFELVVVNSQLQGSLELIERIRLATSMKTTVVLALVSNVEEARKANHLGADFVLNMPLEPKMASRALRAARSMAIHEVRESVREAVRAPATLCYGDIPFEGTVVDVSESGLGIECERLLEVGQQLQIEFSLQGSDRPVRCTGKVVRVEPGRAGVQFLYLSAASAEVVMMWLRSHSPRRAATV